MQAIDILITTMLILHALVVTGVVLSVGALCWFIYQLFFYKG